MNETFMLINNFWTEFERIKKTISHVGGFDGFCQCESEKVIEKMSNATEARSFLMVGILIDQSVRASSSDNLYEDFRSVFTYPKLVAHFDGSDCSSFWFCYHVHGYDKKVDWSNVESVSNIIFSETRDWLIEFYDTLVVERVKRSMLEDIRKNYRANSEAEKLSKLVKNFF